MNETKKSNTGANNKGTEAKKELISCIEKSNLSAKDYKYITGMIFALVCENL